MGYTYEVQYWDWGLKKYVTTWTGKYLFGAIKAMIICKMHGWKCISLIWRP